MIKAKGVKDAVRNELFPTADMVVSMSKEFGVPFTTEDFEGSGYFILLFKFILLNLFYFNCERRLVAYRNTLKIRSWNQQGGLFHLRNSAGVKGL